MGVRGGLVVVWMGVCFGRKGEGGVVLGDVLMVWGWRKGMEEGEVVGMEGWEVVSCGGEKVGVEGWYV